MIVVLSTISTSAGDEPGGRSNRWDFDDLEGWVDGSHAGSPRSYEIRAGQLFMSTRPETRDRVKVRTDERFGVGRYSWKIVIPKMGKGDQFSVGAFLYHDDKHELDFEIGYGTAKVRRELDAGPEQLVCYCTSHGGPYSSTKLLVKAGAVHTFAIDIRQGAGGNYRVQWFVNDQEVKQLQTEFGKEILFYIFCSVENLTFIGDHIPQQKNHALFDFVEFDSMQGG